MNDVSCDVASDVADAVACDVAIEGASPPDVTDDIQASVTLIVLLKCCTCLLAIAATLMYACAA
jgi:hypothetical protein